MAVGAPAAAQLPRPERVLAGPQQGHLQGHQLGLEQRAQHQAAAASPSRPPTAAPHHRSSDALALQASALSQDAPLPRAAGLLRGLHLLAAAPAGRG